MPANSMANVSSIRPRYIGHDYFSLQIRAEWKDQIRQHSSSSSSSKEAINKDFM